MKKIAILLISIIFTQSVIYAQVSKAKREKIKELKIAFLTEKMQLTSDEAAKFWPVYNAFEQKKHDQKRYYRSKVNEVFGISKNEPVNIDKYTNEQIQQVLELQLQMHEKQLQLEKEYYAALKEILPVKKIFLLHQAEKEFKKKMLQEIKNSKD
jgi:Spy/CpxP family protein refolding chaperone